MNKIYLSGIVADPPIRYSESEAPLHVSFPLCVSHKTKQGLVKRELYVIQAWNGVADWAQTHLQQGQRVMVQGYLTQHNTTQPDGSTVTRVEVTAEEFFAAPSVRAKREAQNEGAAEEAS